MPAQVFASLESILLSTGNGRTKRWPLQAMLHFGEMRAGPLVLWIVLSVITIAATGCAELPSQKAQTANANQDPNRYDYFGWW